MYQLIFMGGQAIGSVVWGLLAGATTSSTSLLVSAALLVVCALSSLWWPLHAKTSDLDLTPSSHWPEPHLIFEPEPLDGPVLVLTSYRVARRRRGSFLAAMDVLGRSRQRTGASQWRLFRSVEHESTFVETFIVRSWGEHMHQHYTRLTGQDRLIEEAVERYTDGEAGPSTTWRSADRGRYHHRPAASTHRAGVGDFAVKSVAFGGEPLGRACRAGLVAIHDRDTSAR